jgi:hypothetical protein
LSWAWIVPAAAAGVGVAFAAVLARRAASTAAALRRDIAGLGELRPAMVEARDKMAATAAELRRLHGR